MLFAIFQGMKKRCLLFLILLAWLPSWAHRHDTLSVKRIEFVENKGQWQENVRYRAQLHSGVMFAERNCITYVVLNNEQLAEFYEAKTNPQIHCNGMIDAAAYKMNFLEAELHPNIVGQEMLAAYNNYYIGNDPGKWRSDVKKYHALKYENLYKGIDLVFLQDESHLKYQFEVAPYVSPQQIRLQYEGLKNVSLSKENLVLSTAVGQVLELKPVAYQMVQGRKVLVECHYRVRQGVVTYDLGNYDKTLPLVIDPVLIFSSYSGSTADNWGYSATYDVNGNLYSGGNVFNVGYPTSMGAYQVNYGGGSCDIAISKFDASGSYLHFSTYLGGSGTDIPHSLVVNANDELYVLGSTGSADYPTTVGAYDSTFAGGTNYTLTNVLSYPNGSDIVVTKFNSNGTALLGSTYLGGSKNDGLNTPAGLKKNYADEVRGEIIIDDNSNVYVVSSTQSPDFPTTPGAFQSTFNGGTQDGCVVKMNHNLTNLIWSSFLGGSANDAAYSIVLSSDKSVYVCGGTSSANLATTPGVVQPTYAGGVADGYIAHVSENGDVLLQATYLGRPDYDQTYLIKNDRYNNPHVFGQTIAAGTTWVQNAAWYVAGGGEFISKLTPQLDSIIWSTAFGRGMNTIDISPTALLVDLCNNIYMSGWGSPITNSGLGGTAGMPVTADAFQNTTDNNDYYFICISDDASALVYATYFGSPNAREHVDGGTSRFDNKGRIYQAVCAGCGGFDDFPTTTGAWSEENGSSNCNIGVIKFDFNLPAVIADFNIPNTVCAPVEVYFNNTSQSISPNTTYFWDFGDGTTSAQEFPTHTYAQSGIYTIRLVVQDFGSCNFNDTTTRQLVVLGNSNTNLDNYTICNGGFVQIGVPPSGDAVTYQWNPTSDLSNPTISNPVASPSTTTQYQLYVSNGVCIDTLTQTVVVEDLGVTLPDTVITCEGTPVTLTPVVSGVANQYFWYDNPAMSTPINVDFTQPSWTVSPNNSTNYYVKVRNAYCESVDTVFVRIVPFVVVAPPPYVICYEDTVQISVTVSTYGSCSYHWTPYATIVGNPYLASPRVNPLENTVYMVQVTNEYGCSQTATVTVNIKRLQNDATVQNVSCHGKNDGALSLLPSGGVAPYTYLWSNGGNVGEMQNLPAADYSVMITDAEGCKTLDTFVLTEPAAITLQLQAMEPVLCNQVCNGRLTVSAAGGTGSIAYHWLHGSDGPIADELCAGAYTVIATDENGCSVSGIYEIADTSDNQIQYLIDSLHCLENCDGAISLQLDFGNENYTVLWDDGSEEDSVNGLCVGNYHAHIEELQTGCRYDLYLPIEAPILLYAANVFYYAPSCHGDADGKLVVWPAGGTEPYQMTLNGVACTETVMNLTAGEYHLAITDAQGCRFDTLLTLEQPLPLTVELAATKTPCKEVCNAVVTTDVAGGTAPYFYLWSHGATTSQLADLCVGEYALSLTDAKGCQAQLSISVEDSSLFPGQLVAWTDQDTLYDGYMTELHSTAWEDFDYQWSPAAGVVSPTQPNTMVRPIETACYVVSAADVWGCKQRDTVCLYVVDVLCEEPYVFVPNAFSPNADGKNDVLYVRGEFIESMVFKIFNRWGEELFSTQRLDEGWDGTYKNKMCESGVYDYYVEIQCFGYKKFFKKGNVTLLR